MITEYSDEQLLVLPKQREQITFTGKWAGARGGQGGGKSTGFAYWVWNRLEEYPEQNAVAVGATYTQVREGFFATLQNLMWSHGLEEGRDYTYRRNPSPRMRFTDSGATLHSWSADIVMRIRSVNVQTLVLEEPQTWGPSAEEAWISINGRLRHNMRTAALYPNLEPQGRLSFNPTGVGPGHWLYEMLEKRWPEEGYRVWQMSTRENAILLKDDPGYVRNLEISMSPDRWPVEIDGEYATMGGGVYRQYDSSVHHAPPKALPELALDPRKPLLWTLDFNVGLMCSEIAQAHVQPTILESIVEPNVPPRDVRVRSIPSWQERLFYFIDEMALPDSGAEDLVPTLFAKDDGRYLEVARKNGIVIYGDPSGGNRNQMISGNNPIKTNWQRIFADLRGFGFNYSPTIAPGCFTIRVISGLVHPNDHINMVNSQLKSGDGFGMVVDERCVELLNDFRLVAYEPGTNKVQKKTKPLSAARRTHAGDAAGYLIYVERLMLLEKRQFNWTMER